MIPITLNPHITSLEMRNTEMVRLDDSFQFYEALIDLDLSFNKINLILDKSFISQVIKHIGIRRMEWCISESIEEPVLGP